VPLAGIIPLASSLDHVGPMARSVADCGALLTALAAGGAEVTPLMPAPPTPVQFPMRPSSSASPLAGLTIAVTERPETVGVTAEVASALEGAVAAARTLGARLVTLRSAPDLAGSDYTTILLTEVRAYHQRYQGSDDLYRTSIREFVAQSRPFTSAESYLQAQQRRALITAGWERWFADHGVDAILEPTTPSTAPLRGGGYRSGETAGEGDPLIRLTAIWNGTGFPVASLPAGIGSTSGLPVGISVVGPRGADAIVLQIGIDLQEHALGRLPIAVPAESTLPR
jgi:aspartyl-tRNA(Asn)/glutamyl-tRNA(Gln) amidotransferase subunit A